jgi:hypothetical protein
LKSEPVIITTIDEMQSHAVIQLLIKDIIEDERITIKHYQRNILIDNTIRKWA